MKKTILFISGFILLSAFCDSCVSKKKYEELAQAKRSADRNILNLKKDKTQLEGQLKLAQDDFNAVRYKLTENNAAKDKNIDQLYAKLRSLESKHVELKSELSNVTDQMKTTTQTTEGQIASLEGTLQKITAERDSFRKQLSELQTKLEWENRKLKSELEVASGHIADKDSEIEKLKAENTEINKKLAWIRKTKTSADAEIKKLTNQVNLLKKELNK